MWSLVSPDLLSQAWLTVYSNQDVQHPLVDVPPNDNAISAETPKVMDRGMASVCIPLHGRGGADVT